MSFLPCDPLKYGESEAFSTLTERIPSGMNKGIRGGNSPAASVSTAHTMAPPSSLAKLGLRGALVAIVLPLAALIALQAYQAFWSTPVAILESGWVDGTFEIITTAQRLRSALQDAERGQRGYLLTGEVRYLATYRDGMRRVPVELERFRTLTAGEPAQQQNVASLMSAVNEKLDTMRRTIEVYDASGFDAAQEVVKSDAGLNAMARIEALIQVTTAGERVLLKTREARVAQLERQTRYTALAADVLALGVTLIGIGLAVGAFRNARRHEAARRQMQQRITDHERQLHAVIAQKQKMEALGELTGGVAHDFNNILQLIRNSVSMLQTQLQKANAEVAGSLEVIRRTLDRAATTTRRLLAFARQQPLESKPLDLNTLVQGVEDLLKQVLGKNIDIQTKLDRDLWSICVDRNELETALLNLAINARDAMTGGGRLTVETANVKLDDADAALNPDVRPGSYALISVGDTGCGMPEEVLAKAFEPFFTTKDPGRGTGLGLSQVFGFVKQSGGHVAIDSEVGQGTTVRVYLPATCDAPMR